MPVYLLDSISFKIKEVKSNNLSIIIFSSVIDGVILFNSTASIQFATIFG